MAETAAVGRALSDAGFGLQFADVGEENDPMQVDAGIQIPGMTAQSQAQGNDPPQGGMTWNPRMQSGMQGNNIPPANQYGQNPQPGMTGNPQMQPAMTENRGMQQPNRTRAIIHRLCRRERLISSLRRQHNPIL